MNPIVFIHGFLGSSRDWHATMNAVPNSFALDVPDSKDWAETVDRLSKEIPESAIICGYSMGARLALGCVVNRPGKFKGLIFVSGHPGISDEERKARLTHDRQVAGKLQNTNLERFLQHWYQQSVFSGLDADQRSRLVESKMDVDPYRHAKLLTTNSVAKQPDFWTKLPNIELPVLLLAGSRDKKYVSICQKMAQSLPDSEIIVLADCGHIVHFEQAGLFQQQVLDFRERLDRI